VTAGIVTRTLAAVVDLLVVLVLMGLALLTVAGVRFLVGPISFRWPSPTWPQSVAVGGLLAASYLTAAWATAGRSCGAALLGLRVRSVGGAHLGWFRAGLRSALCLAFPLGLLWAVFDGRRRSLQDLVVGSVVVYDDSPAGDGPRPGAPGQGRDPRVEEDA
jgi:uncharacterized RDD family membrane protein YckC